MIAFPSTNFIVLPYHLLTSGQWSLSDQYMGSVYEKIVKDGDADMVFFTGNIQSIPEFIAYMQGPGAFPWFIFEKDPTAKKLIGYVILDTLKDFMAYCHVYMAPEYRSFDTLFIGREAIQYIFSQTDIETIIGLPPEENQAVCDYAEAIGGVRLGVLPKGIWSHKKQQNVPAVLFHWTKEI